MEDRDLAGNGREQISGLGGVQQRAQASVIGHSPHHDHRLECTTAELDVAHAQVHIGCDPPVQFDLTFTGVTAGLGGALIEHVGHYRLGDLERPILGQQHP